MEKTLEEIIAEYNTKVQSYPKFIYQGIIFTGNHDVFPSPYSIMQYNSNNGQYTIFLNKAGLRYLASSPNGHSDWIFTEVNLPYGAIAFSGGLILTAYHKWFNNQSFFYFQKNGVDVGFIREPHGEDITFIERAELGKPKYRAYARMNVPPAVRSVGVMESNDFVTWSPLKEILTPTESDAGRQFYSMSVIETEKGFFGFVNVFNSLNNKTTIRLVHSLDGLDTMPWTWLNAGNPIIPLETREQLYANASVINNEVHITTISAKFNHSEINRNGRFYYTELWKISLTNLYKYL